jgi:hypothetical protein
MPKRHVGRISDVMAKPTLLPDPTCLHLHLLDASGAAITAHVSTTTEEAVCPLCQQPSARIHSRYIRSIADLPWMGCAVRLELHVRRFFCPNPECTRQIFTERLPSIVAPYARRTVGGPFIPFNDLVGHQPLLLRESTSTFKICLQGGIGFRRGADGRTVTPLRIGLRAIQLSP